MRIAEFAFAQAKAEGRKKITAVHKANIMKLGDGLFLAWCKEVSKRYPDIQFDTMIVDNTCMQVRIKYFNFTFKVKLSNLMHAKSKSKRIESNRKFGKKFNF